MLLLRLLLLLLLLRLLCLLLGFLFKSFLGLCVLDCVVGMRRLLVVLGLGRLLLRLYLLGSLFNHLEDRKRNSFFFLLSRVRNCVRPPSQNQAVKISSRLDD